MCDWLGSVEQIENDGCGEQFMEPERAYDLINAYTLAWSRFHLTNDAGVVDLLEGQTRPWPEVELSRKSDL